MSEASDYEVEIHELAPTHTAVIKKTVAWSEISGALAGIYPEVLSYLHTAGIEPERAPFARYAPRDAGVEIEAGFMTEATPIQGNGTIEPSRLPGGEAAVCLHVGPYAGVSEAYEAVTAWLKEQGREPAGAPWEVYTSPPDEDPPVTEVVFPLKGAS